MIKDVCFNDRNAVLGICDFDAKIVILRSKPARSQKLRSGLKASLAPIDGSVLYHSQPNLACHSRNGEAVAMAGPLYEWRHSARDSHKFPKTPTHGSSWLGDHNALASHRTRRRSRRSAFLRAVFCAGPMLSSSVGFVPRSSSRGRPIRRLTVR